jgi:hypothetical protein
VEDLFKLAPLKGVAARNVPTAGNKWVVWALIYKVLVWILEVVDVGTKIIFNNVQIGARPREINANHLIGCRP